MSTRLNMVLDPVLKFRVQSIRNGAVVLEVYPMVASDLPKRLELIVGDTWEYALTLDGNGFHQENRVEHDQRALPQEAERKGIAGHFRRRS